MAFSCSRWSLQGSASEKVPVRIDSTDASWTAAEPVEFLRRHPDYELTRALDRLRVTEYSYLDEQRQTYLDYTGAGLAAKAQLRAHQERLGGGVFGNPHSVNPTSAASTELV